MPASYPNLEKSGFHPGQYVGYSEGAVFRIRRIPNSKRWQATQQNGPACFSRNSLGAIAAKLEEMTRESRNAAR